LNSVFEKILTGVKAVAPMAANLLVPGSGTLVEGLMRAVTGDGPDTPIEAVAEKIAADPALMVQLQTKAMDHEARLAEIEANKLASVNQTMQAESKSERWPQYSWRPFNGFMFPVAVVLIYFVLPVSKQIVPEVPQWVWMGWLSILGVATWDRGKEKRAKAGETKPGLIAGAIKALRG
jgi:Holin of 3TMs, for gene-transfer release